MVQFCWKGFLSPSEFLINRRMIDLLVLAFSSFCRCRSKDLYLYHYPLTFFFPLAALGIKLKAFALTELHAQPFIFYETVFTGWGGSFRLNLIMAIGKQRGGTGKEHTLPATALPPAPGAPSLWGVWPPCPSHCAHACGFAGHRGSEPSCVRHGFISRLALMFSLIFYVCFTTEHTAFCILAVDLSTWGQAHVALCPPAFSGVHTQRPCPATFACWQGP